MEVSVPPPAPTPAPAPGGDGRSAVEVVPGVTVSLTDEIRYHTRSELENVSWRVD